MTDHATTSAAPAPTSVDFHFDVLCPYAYQTSKWIRSVRDRLGITVNWRFFSLEEINRVEGKKHPWEREWSYGWSIMRIGALLRRRSNDDLDRWYERTGRALHEDGHRPHDPDVARHLLDELGLDRVDRKMLATMMDKFCGGPVGLDTLAATTGEDAVTIEDVYEPYLMQLGFLTRTPRGRCVTRKAYEHLHMDFMGQEQLEL